MKLEYSLFFIRKAFFIQLTGKINYCFPFCIIQLFELIFTSFLNDKIFLGLRRNLPIVLKSLF